MTRRQQRGVAVGVRAVLQDGGLHLGRTLQLRLRWLDAGIQAPSTVDDAAQRCAIEESDSALRARFGCTAPAVPPGTRSPPSDGDWVSAALADTTPAVVQEEWLVALARADAALRTAVARCDIRP